MTVAWIPAFDVVPGDLVWLESADGTDVDGVPRQPCEVLAVRSGERGAIAEVRVIVDGVWSRLTLWTPVSNLSRKRGG